MDSHINWGEPEKPPVMNFARVMCFVLGGAGLLIAGFLGIASSSWTTFLFLGVVLGLPIYMAIVARPRYWFTAPDPSLPYTEESGPWWKITVDQEYYFFGKNPFTSLKKVDYVLLVIMVIVTIAMSPLVLPSLIPGIRDYLGSEVYVVPASVLGAAYFWQLSFTARHSVLAASISVFVGVAIYVDAILRHYHENLIPGTVGLNIGMWSLIRLAIYQVVIGKSSVGEAKVDTK